MIRILLTAFSACIAQLLGIRRSIGRREQSFVLCSACVLVLWLALTYTLRADQPLPNEPFPHRSAPAMGTSEARGSRTRLRPPLTLSLDADLKEQPPRRRRELSGRVYERWFYSRALGMELPYVIYLPPDYHLHGRDAFAVESGGVADERGSAREYPVLYMLHGRGGERNEWVVAGLVRSADRAIGAGDIPPMLIVCPEGFTGYWTDHADGGPRWGEYVLRDIVMHVDASYSTIRRPWARAIGGVSMGGWGALHHGFSHPEVFGVVGAHSPALRPDDGTLRFLGTGPEFDRKNPLSLARGLARDVRLKIWIDTGRDDPWMGRASLLHTILLERGVPHTWNLYPGGHNWEHWRAHVDEYVRFYGSALAAGG